MEASLASLPPGPRLPRILQTLGFIFTPIRWIEANRRRYGDMVTFSTAFDSGFVMVFEPGPGQAGLPGLAGPAAGGRGQRGARAGARAALGAPARRRRAPAPAQADAAAVPRPAHADLRAGDGARPPTTRSTAGRWASRSAASPSMQSLTLDVIMRAVFGVEEGERRDELKRRVRATIDPVGASRRAASCS